MTYSQSLGRRLRQNAKARKAPAGDPTAAADVAGQTGFVSPFRYPKHSDPLKGQVVGGECNVTRCTSTGARHFNRSTFGLYCPRCAHGIGALCVPVEVKPTAEEMQAMQRAAAKELF